MGLKENKYVTLAYSKLQGYKISNQGKNNLIKNHKSIIKKSKVTTIGNNCTVNIGSGTRLINSSIIVIGDNHKVEIGDNCIIKNTTLWIEDEKCKIIVGNETTIEGAHIAVTEPNSSITLGKDCMLSGDIDIRNGDSHSIIDIESGRRINYAKDIQIGNHVWVGNSVQILKGVKIGDNSIVGIRSIVTKDIPSNSIATGSPAKVVKNGVTWNRERIYD